jgi:hypothetical protein
MEERAASLQWRDVLRPYSSEFRSDSDFDSVVEFLLRSRVLLSEALYFSTRRRSRRNQEVGSVVELLRACEGKAMESSDSVLWFRQKGKLSPEEGALLVSLGFEKKHLTMATVSHLTRLGVAKERAEALLSDLRENAVEGSVDRRDVGTLVDDTGTALPLSLSLKCSSGSFLRGCDPVTSLFDTFPLSTNFCSSPIETFKNSRFRCFPPSKPVSE